MMKHVTRGVCVSLFLSMLFLSCKEENPAFEKTVEGKEVFLQIRTLEVAEGGESELARGAFLQESEFIPNGDGLFVKLGVEEDAASPFRAVKQLVSGAHFRVIAVRAGTSIYISHGDFIVGGATSLPDFHVTENTNYDIICFSYNNITNPLPAFNPARYDDISDIKLSGDLENLLWEKQALHVGTTDPSVSILLDYKVARIRVVVDCTYNGWTITSVANTMKISSVALVQSVNLISGDPAGGSAGEQTVTWPTLVGNTEQTSNSLVVMPTNSDVTLTVTIPVSSVSRQGFLPIPTMAGYTGKFTATLLGGHSYRLLVKLKAPIFAGSNIYWSGNDTSGSLTFDEAGSTDNQDIQGLLFKWGSLVGISPTEPMAFSSSVPVFRWGESTPTSHSDWGSIPFWDSTFGNVITGDQTSGFRGDICTKIRSTYRLPKSSELGAGGSSWNTTNPTTAPVAGGWVAGSAPSSWPTSERANVGNKYGTAHFASSSYGTVKNITLNNMVLTTPGIRHHNGENSYLSFRGTVGGYWSSSFTDANHARFLYFTKDEISAAAGNPRYYAMPVRCVKAD